MFDFLDSFSPSSGALSKYSIKGLSRHLCLSVYLQMIYAVQYRYSMYLLFANNTKNFHAVVFPNNSSRSQSIVYDVDALTIS
jgi:hypothetical protein